MWEKNQDVTLNVLDNELLVSSNQNTSTPGIVKHNISVFPGSAYEFSAEGKKVFNENYKDFSVYPFIRSSDSSTIIYNNGYNDNLLSFTHKELGYDDRSIEIVIMIPDNIYSIDLFLLFQGQDENSQFVLESSNFVKFKVSNVTAMQAMSKYINESTERNLQMKTTLTNMIWPKEDRDLLNVPTTEDIAIFKKRWDDFGNRLFSIPALLQELPELHEKYIGIVKNTYFYYKGLDTQYRGLEFREDKYDTYTKVVAWAREHYYNGTPKISDVTYDHMKQNIFVRTRINPKSNVTRVNHEHVITNSDPTIHCPKLWAECGPKMYHLDILAKEDPELHARYIDVRKISYYYFLEIPLEDNTYRGPEGKLRYAQYKYDTINDVCKWARENYYSGKPSFTDMQYDYLKQNRIVRNDTNSRSVNINDVLL